MPKETIIQNNCAVWLQQHPHYPSVLLSSPKSLPVLWLSQRRMCRQGRGRSHNDKHIPVSVTWVFNSAHQKHSLSYFHGPLVAKRKDKFPISSLSGQIRKGPSVWNTGNVSWGLVDPILNPIQEGESPPPPRFLQHATITPSTLRLNMSRGGLLWWSRGLGKGALLIHRSQGSGPCGNPLFKAALS